MKEKKQIIHCLCGRRKQTFKQSEARRFLDEHPFVTCGSEKCNSLLPVRPEGFIDIQVLVLGGCWSHLYKQPNAEESASLCWSRLLQRTPLEKNNE